MNNYDRLSDIRKEADVNASIRARQQQGELLRRSIETKIRTSFIFPLAEFERVFGYLWGHDIQDKSTLTENQLQFLQIYQEVRKAILDNGNVNIRSAVSELSNYEVVLKSRSVQFKGNT